jgi:hypothetical protein
MQPSSENKEPSAGGRDQMLGGCPRAAGTLTGYPWRFIARI